MPETISDTRLWVNDNGRIVCRDHGGFTLHSHVSSHPHQVHEFTTDLDHWLLVPADLALVRGFSCEDCGR